MPGEADDLRSGLEHLQKAAKELIEATRSVLDAAEELVDDPAAIQGVVATLASLAQAASVRLRSDPRRPRSGAPGSDHSGEDPDDGPIQRIRIS